MKTDKKNLNREELLLELENSEKIDLKSKNIEELYIIADLIRDRILTTVSKNGGHLSSTLGAVELIIGMHTVFDSIENPFIFDVSHQSYAHKLLTGRWKKFETLRQLNGLSGYTKPSESDHDFYVAGHSSTSVSLGVGLAKVFKLKEQNNRTPIAFIGDGSMTAGMVYEALNELGERKYPMIIVLNDNEMSIAKPIGAISRVLSQAMASNFYQKIKTKTEQLLTHFPDGASYLAKRFEESFRLITPGILFEEMGVEYIGPIDGHDIKSVIETLKLAKDLKKPVIIHAQTLKGKGYEIAEGHLEHWHGVSAFDVETGKSIKKGGSKSATKIYSEKLHELASKDEKIVGVTAAMPSGTGLDNLIDSFPERFWDVAIAEQHAVTSMGSLAKEGFKPFCTIYSTFLQRGYDSVIHDIALANVPVSFAIDRAGIVGEDGETHAGAFDLSFLRPIPNMVIFAPWDETTMRSAIEFSANINKPNAFRYPRGSFLASSEELNIAPDEFKLGKSQFLFNQEPENLENIKIIFIGYGNGVGRAIQTAKLFDNFSEILILDLRFLKPLDSESLLKLTQYQNAKKWFIFSESAKIGGVGSAISEFLQEQNITDINIISFEFEDKFLPHGKTQDVEKQLNLTPEQLKNRVIHLLK
jgi:1-deoxy-D-xylulose-5-phosphate synthase